MNIRLLILLIAIPLGGCDMQTFKSSVAGSCAVFQRPAYAVLGKTSYDQGVADNFVESGVAGCGWQRPAVRPAALDAGRKIIAPVKKRGIVKRIKDRVWPKSAAPIVPTPEPTPPVISEPAPSPTAPPVIAQPPRDPVDELLHPSR